MKRRMAAFTVAGLVTAFAVSIAPHDKPYAGTPKAVFQHVSNGLLQGFRGVTPCVGEEWTPVTAYALERCVVIPGRREGDLIATQGVRKIIAENISRMKLTSGGWYDDGGEVNEVSYVVKGVGKQVIYIFHNASNDENERLTFFVEGKK